MNLPNKLSMLRIFLIPVFLLLLYSNIQYAVELATLVFILGAVTDILDGHIARSRNLITDFGKFIDPLADKMLVLSAFIYLVGVGRIPDWMVIIIIGREFAVSGLRILAANQRVVIAASKMGKFKTQSQMIAVILALLEWPDLVFLGQQVYWWIALLAVILTIVSGVDYLWKGKKHISEC
ncbi:MAG: CDP-diacylglycerol--glycerol-3-phosphate 3-phosphatidyltransferase [Thermoplasmata archaeon]|nr:CDP-diacylglycerol--glycerol-3-phosphate 3-phosphatidyltransferase [Thermoplasmata archaeon]